MLNSSNKERRAHPRVPFNEPVVVKIKGKRKKKFHGRDLSCGGISFYSDHAIDANKMYIKIVPPQGLVDDIFDSGCKIKGKLVEHRAEQLDQDKKYVAIQFEKTLIERVREIYKTRIKTGFFIIPLILIVLFLLKGINVKFYWYQPVFNIYSLIVTTYILSRFVLALFYVPPKDVNYMPTVTFVIPVRNDEEIISEAVSSCFKVNYPMDKIEVIAVNDGSTDSTLEKLKKLKKLIPN